MTLNEHHLWKFILQDQIIYAELVCIILNCPTKIRIMQKKFSIDNLILEDKFSEVVLVEGHPNFRWKWSELWCDWNWMQQQKNMFNLVLH